MPLLQQAFVIVLLPLAIAAMPVQTPDAGSACTEGTIKTNPQLLNCRNETPSIPVTERIEVLTWLINDAIALRKKAQGVCRQLSNCSVSTYIRLYIYIYLLHTIATRESHYCIAIVTTSAATMSVYLLHLHNFASV